MSDFGIKYYIKVSTTGLGGMGVNLKYTHGDLNEPGMSSGILGKVAAAGVFHQLMWSLSHTPGYNIRIVVPAALVGWQPVKFGKFRSHGKHPVMVDNKKIITLKKGDTLDVSKSKKMGGYLEIPYVDSGENSAYSLYEMQAITALGQMESVTREEIAEAVYQSLYGSTRYDLLTAMDYASLGPSYSAAFKRKVVLDELRELQKVKKVPSIATNNLGPTVSKHLFELYILFDLNNFDIDKIIRQSSQKLAEAAQEYIMKGNNIVRIEALSLGLPILLDENKLVLGEHYLVPDASFKNIISPNSIEKWAASGWIDLREKNVAKWQRWLKKAIQEYKKKAKVDVYINRRAVESMEIGEILGLIYSLQGGSRRKTFIP